MIPLYILVRFGRDHCVEFNYNETTYFWYVLNNKYNSYTSSGLPSLSKAESRELLHNFKRYYKHAKLQNVPIFDNYLDICLKVRHY